MKPARVGGPVAAAEIAAMAAERGVPVVVSTLFETGVGHRGRARARRGARGVRLAGRRTSTTASRPPGVLEHDLLREALVVEDGRMWLPDAAGPGGLGVEVDEDAVGRYRLDAVEAVG